MSSLKRLKLPMDKEKDKTPQFSISRIFTIILLMVLIALVVYEVALKPEPLSQLYAPDEFNNPFVVSAPKDTFIAEDSIETTDFEKVVWRDNPAELAKYYTIEAFFLGSPNRVRINHNLLSSGDYLDENFKIIKIEPPVVFLSDKQGNMHRLVHRRDWKSACAVFNWNNKDLYKDDEIKETTNTEDEKPEITEFVGPYKILNASKAQLEIIHQWISENPEYTEEQLIEELKSKGLQYKPALGSGYGGRLKFE